MALQNIGASNRDDAFYRYKMPRMVTKIEGRGNGIKTNIVNMVEIAKALARPAAYTTKYFGCELGAQSKFDEKTGVSLVNGSHDTPKLAGLLENFIKKYVQCYGCGNPETEIIITKTQMLNLKCAACGFISDVDMRDKLTTFILKNPPEQKKSSKDKKAMRRAEKERLKEGEAADEEMKKIKKETVVGKKKATSGSSKPLTKKKANGSDEDRSPPLSQAGENDDVEDDDDIQWQTDTSLEAVQLRMQEQLSAVTADMVMLSTAEDKKSSGKKSPDREENTAQEKPKSGKNLPECEKTTEEPNPGKKSPEGENLVDSIKAHLKKPSARNDFRSFLGSLSEKPQDIMDALIVSLFEGVGKGFAKAAAGKKSFLAEAAAGDSASQTMLLNALESFCQKTSPEAAKEIALVLKALYDDDVIEEEIVLEWYNNGDKSSPIWKKVKPFVEWLQSAESESESE